MLCHGHHLEGLLSKTCALPRRVNWKVLVIDRRYLKDLMKSLRFIVQRLAVVRKCRNDAVLNHIAQNPNQSSSNRSPSRG